MRALDLYWSVTSTDARGEPEHEAHINAQTSVPPEMAPRASRSLARCSAALRCFSEFAAIWVAFSSLRV